MCDKLLSMISDLKDVSRGVGGDDAITLKGNYNGKRKRNRQPSAREIRALDGANRREWQAVLPFGPYEGQG